MLLKFYLYKFAGSFCECEKQIFKNNCETLRDKHKCDSYFA